MVVPRVIAGAPTLLRPEILNPPPDWFKALICGRLSGPVDVLTGEQLWPGKRFHGGQLDFMKSNARYKQASGGIRAGKSDVVTTDLLIDLLWEWRCGKMADLYWIIGPSYELCEEEMRHLDRMLTELGVEHSFNQPKKESWTIAFPGIECMVQTRTGTEAARIAARACRKVLLVEAHQLGPDIWRNARERVLQMRGGVTASGTFEDSGEQGDWYRSIAIEWAEAMGLGKERFGDTFSLATWENVVLFPLGRDDPWIQHEEDNLTPSVFMERYGGKPAKSSKMVMPQAERRFQVRHRYPLQQTSYDPELPVYLFSDPGWVHAYAVLAVQFIGNTCWVIDIVYRFERLATEIIAECATRPWAKQVVAHVMDFAARQKRAEGPALVEQWAIEWFRILRTRPSIITQPVPLHSGYEIHRKALLNTWEEKEAQLQFNADRFIRRNVTNPDGVMLFFDPIAAQPLFGGTVDGKKWEGEYNMHRNKKTALGQPLSDEPFDVYNDAIKALNYGLYWRYGASENRRNIHDMQSRGETMDWSIAV